MKTIFYLIAACAVVFTACQNDNSVNPRPTDQIIGKATIKGKVTAELNTTNTVRENAPDGTKVTAEIYVSDLVLSGSSSNAKKYYETTVTNGEYSLDVEVGPQGSITTTLYFSDFRADQTTSTTPVSKIYTASSTNVSLKKNQTKIVDVNFNNN